MSRINKHSSIQTVQAARSSVFVFVWVAVGSNWTEDEVPFANSIKKILVFFINKIFTASKREII